MYARYNHGQCAPKAKLIPTPPLMKPLYMPGPGAIPESARMAQEQCSFAWVATQGTPTCSSTSPNTVVQVPLIAGTPPPVVPVISVPASASMNGQKQVVANSESDQYNPATRFAQYFPAPPIPYCPPMRMPNNEPLPPMVPCMPPTRFQGSSSNA